MNNSTTFTSRIDQATLLIANMRRMTMTVCCIVHTYPGKERLLI
jgi:hypothetical protein